MTRYRVLILATVMAAVVLTLAAINNPTLAVGGFAAIAAIVAFARVRGWWRRAYVLTILAMFIGASHMQALTLVGSVAKMGAVVLLAAVTWVTTANAKGEYRNGLHKATMYLLWATVGLAAMSALWSQARVATVSQTVIFALFVFILHRASTIRWADREVMTADIATAYWTSTLGLTAGAAMAAVGVRGAVSTFDGRHLGILNNPNLLGMIAAITLAVGVGVALHRRNPLVWASLLIPLSQVLLSQSRTALIAVSVGLLWSVLRGGIVRIVVVGVAAFIVSVAASLYQLNPFGDLLSRFGEREGGDVLNMRTMAWEDVFRYVQNNPLGTGWAATTDALASLNADGVTSGLTSIHNSYLQIIFELGWVGAIPAVLILALLLVVACRANAQGLGAGLVAAAVAGALIQFAESAIFGIGQPYPYLFWFALLAAVVNTDPKPKTAREMKRGKFYTLEPGTGKVRAVR